MTQAATPLQQAAPLGTPAAAPPNLQITAPPGDQVVFGQAAATITAQSVGCDLTGDEATITYGIEGGPDKTFTVQGIPANLRADLQTFVQAAIETNEGWAAGSSTVSTGATINPLAAGPSAASLPAQGGLLVIQLAQGAKLAGPAALTAAQGAPSTAGYTVNGSAVVQGFAVGDNTLTIPWTDVSGTQQKSTITVTVS